MSNIILFSSNDYPFGSLHNNFLINIDENIFSAGKSKSGSTIIYSNNEKWNSVTHYIYYNLLENPVNQITISNSSIFSDSNKYQIDNTIKKINELKNISQIYFKNSNNIGIINNFIPELVSQLEYIYNKIINIQHPTVNQNIKIIISIYELILKKKVTSTSQLDLTEYLSIDINKPSQSKNILKDYNIKYLDISQIKKLITLLNTYSNTLNKNILVINRKNNIKIPILSTEIKLKVSNIDTKNTGIEQLKIFSSELYTLSKLDILKLYKKYGLFSLNIFLDIPESPKGISRITKSSIEELDKLKLKDDYKQLIDKELKNIISQKSKYNINISNIDSDNKEFTEFTRGRNKTYEINTLYSKLKVLKDTTKIDNHDIYKHFKTLQNNELNNILIDELYKIYMMIIDNQDYYLTLPEKKIWNKTIENIRSKINSGYNIVFSNNLYDNFYDKYSSIYNLSNIKYLLYTGNNSKLSYSNIYGKTLKKVIYQLKQKNISSKNLFLDKLYFNFFCYFIYLKIAFLTHILDIKKLTSLYIIDFNIILKQYYSTSKKTNYNLDLFSNILENKKNISDKNIKLFKYIINYEKNNYSKIILFRDKNSYNLYDISSYIINNIEGTNNKNLLQITYNNLPSQNKIIKNNEISLINNFFKNIQKTDSNIIDDSEEYLDIPAGRGKESQSRDLSKKSSFKSNKVYIIEIQNNNLINIRPNTFNIQYIYMNHIIKKYTKQYNKLLQHKYSTLFSEFLFLLRYKKYSKRISDKEYSKMIKPIIGNTDTLKKYFNSTVLNKITLQQYNSYIKKIFKCFWDNTDQYKLKDKYKDKFNSFNIIISNNNIPNKLNSDETLSKISRLNIDKFNPKKFNFQQKKIQINKPPNDSSILNQEKIKNLDFSDIDHSDIKIITENIKLRNNENIKTLENTFTVITSNNEQNKQNNKIQQDLIGYILSSQKYDNTSIIINNINKVSSTNVIPNHNNVYIDIYGNNIKYLLTSKYLGDLYILQDTNIILKFKNRSSSTQFLNNFIFIGFLRNNYIILYNNNDIYHIKKLLRYIILPNNLDYSNTLSQYLKREIGDTKKIMISLNNNLPTTPQQNFKYENSKNLLQENGNFKFPSKSQDVIDSSLKQDIIINMTDTLSPDYIHKYMLLNIEQFKFLSIYQYLLLIIICYYSYVNDTKTSLFRLIKSSKLNYTNILKKYYFILISNRIINIFLNNYSIKELKNIFTKEHTKILENYLTDKVKYHSQFKNVLIQNFLLSKLKTNRHYDYLKNNFNIINDEYNIIINNIEDGKKLDNTPGIYTKINNLVNPNNWNKIISSKVIEQFIASNINNDKYKILTNILIKVQNGKAGYITGWFKQNNINNIYIKQKNYNENYSIFKSHKHTIQSFYYIINKNLTDYYTYILNYALNQKFNLINNLQNILISTKFNNIIYKSNDLLLGSKKQIDFKSENKYVGNNLVGKKLIYIRDYILFSKYLINTILIQNIQNPTPFKTYINIYKQYIKNNYNTNLTWINLRGYKNTLYTNLTKLTQHINDLEKDSNSTPKQAIQITITDHLYNYFNYINILSSDDINNFIQNNLDLIVITNIKQNIKNTIQPNILYRNYTIKNTYKLNDLIYVPINKIIQYYTPLNSKGYKITFISDDYYTINNKNYDIQDIIDYNKSKNNYDILTFVLKSIYNLDKKQYICNSTSQYINWFRSIINSNLAITNNIIAYYKLITTTVNDDFTIDSSSQINFPPYDFDINIFLDIINNMGNNCYENIDEIKMLFSSESSKIYDIMPSNSVNVFLHKTKNKINYIYNNIDIFNNFVSKQYDNIGTNLQQTQPSSKSKKDITITQKTNNPYLLFLSNKYKIFNHNKRLSCLYVLFNDIINKNQGSIFNKNWTKDTTTYKSIISQIRNIDDITTQHIKQYKTNKQNYDTQLTQLITDNTQKNTSINIKQTFDSMILKFFLFKDTKKYVNNIIQDHLKAYGFGINLEFFYNGTNINQTYIFDQRNFQDIKQYNIFRQRILSQITTSIIINKNKQYNIDLYHLALDKFFTQYIENISEIINHLKIFINIENNNIFNFTIKTKDLIPKLFLPQDNKNKSYSDSNDLDFKSKQNMEINNILHKPFNKFIYDYIITKHKLLTNIPKSSNTNYQNLKILNKIHKIIIHYNINEIIKTYKIISNLQIKISHLKNSAKYSEIISNKKNIFQNNITNTTRYFIILIFNYIQNISKKFINIDKKFKLDTLQQFIVCIQNFNNRNISTNNNFLNITSPKYKKLSLYALAIINILALFKQTLKNVFNIHFPLTKNTSKNDFILVNNIIFNEIGQFSKQNIIKYDYDSTLVQLKQQDEQSDIKDFNNYVFTSQNKSKINNHLIQLNLYQNKNNLIDNNIIYNFFNLLYKLTKIPFRAKKLNKLDLQLIIKNRINIYSSLKIFKDIFKK